MSFLLTPKSKSYGGFSLLYSEQINNICIRLNFQHKKDGFRNFVHTVLKVVKFTIEQVVYSEMITHVITLFE